MIIQFSLSNYKSIFRIQTLNFRATNLVSEDKDVDKRNIAKIGTSRILKTIGIYGANGSGKSNIIKGFVFFKTMISSSLNVENLSKNELSPFRQSSEKIGNSGYFEIVLLIQNKKYRYGFTLNDNADIQEEWLYGPAEKNETYYFIRKDGTLNINPLWFQEGDDLPKEKLGSNFLFLNFCSSYDGIISKSIKDFISNKITIDRSNRSIRRFPGNIRSGGILDSTDNLIATGNKSLILNWLKEAGLSFSNIELTKIEISGKHYGNLVNLSKNVYDSKGEVQGNTVMNLDEDESEGTRKFYSYIGRLHRKFAEGGLFISDEIDGNFHPSLLRKLISYFNNPDFNKANAQLLFTSHDTNLMNPEIMRRDQFYFTEKSLNDQTVLYSLSDLKGIRNNADFARQYLSGFYGALPILGTYMEDKISV